jgi:hypothetical protein
MSLQPSDPWRTNILFLTDNLTDRFGEIPIPRLANGRRCDSVGLEDPCAVGSGADTKLRCTT